MIAGFFAARRKNQQVGASSIPNKGKNTFLDDAQFWIFSENIV